MKKHQIYEGTDTAHFPTSLPNHRNIHREAIKQQITEISRKVGQILINSPDEALTLAKEALRLARLIGDGASLARSYLMVGECYRIAEKWTMAGRYLRRALDDGKVRPDESTKSIAWLSIGKICHMHGSHVEAMEFFERALMIARAMQGSERIIAALVSIGDTYRILGEYSKALDALGEALAISRQVSNIHGVGVTLTNIAIIQTYIHDYDNALAAYLESLDIARKRSDRESEAIALINIGTMLRQTGNTKDAIGYFEQAHNVFAGNEEHTYKAIAIAGIASINSLQGELDSSLELLHQALHIYEKTGYTCGRAEAISMMGNIFLQKGDCKSARDRFCEALCLSKEMGYKHLELDLHKSLAELDERMGEYHPALHHYKEFLDLKSELDTQDVRRRIAELEMRKELEKLEKDRDAFRQSVATLQSEIGSKAEQLTAMTLQLAEHHRFLSYLKENVLPNAPSSAHSLVSEIREQIARTTHRKDHWDLFEHQFRQVHHACLQVLSERYPTLTPTELKICALLRIALTSEEIADVLNTSVNTVTTHRRRIRTKLGLHRQVNLVSFLVAIDDSTSIVSVPRD